MLYFAVFTLGFNAGVMLTLFVTDAFKALRGHGISAFRRHIDRRKGTRMRGKLIAVLTVLVGLAIPLVVVLAGQTYYVCHITADHPLEEPHYNYLELGGLSGHFWFGNPALPKHGAWSPSHSAILWDFVTVAGDTDCDGRGPTPTDTPEPTATQVPTPTETPVVTEPPIETEPPVDPTATPTETPIGTEPPVDPTITPVPQPECQAGVYYVFRYRTEDWVSWYWNGGECIIYTRGPAPSADRISDLCDCPAINYRYDGVLIDSGEVVIGCDGSVVSAPEWLYHVDPGYAFGAEATFDDCVDCIIE